jgi:hypothetical protein
MIFDFLWRLRGSVAIDPTTTDGAVLAHVERLLSRQGKVILRRGLEGLSFNSPVWQIAITVPFRSMYIVDRGRFWITEGQRGRRLHYSLHSFPLTLISLLSAGMFFALVWAAEGFVRAVVFAGLAFALVYGLNFLPAAVRVPLAIHGAVRKARRES